MSEVKPGPDASAVAPETTPLSTAATQNTPPQTPAAPPPTPELQPEVEPIPATPEEFKARLEAERAKVLNEYRAKAGAEGGWMAALAPEDREFLKTNPWALREMKAKIEGYEKAMSSFGQKGEPQAPEPDPLEAEAEELVKLAQTQDIEPKVFYRKMVDVQAKIARREAERVHQASFKPSYQAMTYEQQKQTVLADPRMKDPDFEAVVIGIDIQEHRKTGRWLPPLEVLAMAEKRHASTNGTNGHAEPRVTPSLGETRSVATPPNTPSLSIAERFARTASGKRMLRGE